MSLSGSQGNLWTSEAGLQSVSPSNGASATPHFASKHLVRGLTPPGGTTSDVPSGEMNELGLSDSQQHHAAGHVSHGGVDPGTSSSTPVRPANPRVPTSQDDVSLSSLRSRRLLSGYLFGSPQIDSATPTREDGDSARAAAAAAVSPRAARHDADIPLDVPPHPPPTPSTVVSGQEEEIIDEAAGRISPSTEEENTFAATDDALDGFLDGEADADDRATAVQAEHGGSQGYMRNEPGAAGEYRFPTHRLKRKMKGGSTGGILEDSTADRDQTRTRFRS